MVSGGQEVLAVSWSGPFRGKATLVDRDCEGAEGAAGLFCFDEGGEICDGDAVAELEPRAARERDLVRDVVTCTRR